MRRVGLILLVCLGCGPDEPKPEAPQQCAQASGELPDEDSPCEMEGQVCLAELLACETGPYAVCLGRVWEHRPSESVDCEEPPVTSGSTEAETTGTGSTGTGSTG